jgi:hypothetical protein
MANNAEELIIACAQTVARMELSFAKNLNF